MPVSNMSNEQIKQFAEAKASFWKNVTFRIDMLVAAHNTIPGGLSGAQITAARNALITHVANNEPSIEAFGG